MRKSICILSLSVAIQRDGRVLRQIEYLSQTYDLTVIGFGKPPFPQSTITWLPVDRHDSLPRKVIDYVLLLLGRLIPKLYDVWFWSRPRYKQVIAYIAQADPDGILANDWAMNVLAVTAAKRVPVVFDIHEYWELEGETSRLWLLFFAPMIRHFMRNHAAQATATTTVSPIIASRYHEELGLQPTLVFSAPKTAVISYHELSSESIRLIHHGTAARNRHLEMMIDAVAQADKRYTLTFMLVDHGDGYVDELRRYAQHAASGRVAFREPVSPTEIVTAISAFDIGLCLIVPTTYNYRAALPNKFFESVNAGLAVCTGPTPAMADMVNEYGFGFVTPTFDAKDLAKSLNALTIAQLSTMQNAARNAAKLLNADHETGKFVRLFDELTAGA